MSHVVRSWQAIFEISSVNKGKLVKGRMVYWILHGENGTHHAYTVPGSRCDDIVRSNIMTCGGNRSGVLVGER